MKLFDLVRVTELLAELVYQLHFSGRQTLLSLMCIFKNIQTVVKNDQTVVLNVQTVVKNDPTSTFCRMGAHFAKLSRMGTMCILIFLTMFVIFSLQVYNHHGSLPQWIKHCLCYYYIMLFTS